MATIHLLIGIPGCGKSTFAEKYSKKSNIEIVSTDAIRMANPGILEEEVWPRVYFRIGELLNNNLDVIYDATNITPKVRKRLVDNVSVHCDKFEVVAYYFNVDWRICHDRVKERNNDPNEHYLPVEVVESYGQKIVEPSLEEGFTEIKYIDSIGNIYLTKYKEGGTYESK